MLLLSAWAAANPSRYGIQLRCPPRTVLNGQPRRHEDEYGHVHFGQRLGGMANHEEIRGSDESSSDDDDDSDDGDSEDDEHG